MTVLYRKYRPKAFAEVAGQEHVKAALSHQVASGKVAHSYLFSGPRGVGKTTIARIFAKAVNCLERSTEGDPCGACVACLEIAEGRSLDVIEIDAASHTGVDNVREQIIENARFAPSKLAYKVFIVDEVHMLSNSAFNALLKTLEEPPEKVVFILATTELHKLPATVVSRCQRFDFRKIPAGLMTERLTRLLADEGATADADVLETIARMSEGCLRDAESLLGQLLALGEKTLTAETASAVLPIIPAQAAEALLGSLVSREAAETLKAWEGLLAGGADPVRIVTDLIERARERMLAGLAADPAASARLAALLERLVRAVAEMKRMDPPELAFELLAVEWSLEAVAASAPAPRPVPPRPPAPPNDAPRVETAPVETPRVETPRAETTPAQAGAQAEPAPVAERRTELPPMPSEELQAIRGRWSEVLAAAQTRNHSLPYMLGVAELVSLSDGMLTLGFQYAMYRDRLGEHRHREPLEAALSEVFGATMRVKSILVAQRTDGLVEPAPGIRIEKTAKNLPEGFDEMVKAFGGTVA